MARQPNDNPERISRHQHEEGLRAPTYVVVLEIVVLIACMAMAVWIVLNPAVVYAPTPRVALFLMMAFVPAILFASKAATSFKLRIKGFAFTTTAAVAVSCGVFVLLNLFSKPEEQIAAFHVLGESNEELTLELPNQVVVSANQRGLVPNYCVSANNLLMVFPEQVESVNLTVKHPGTGKAYRGSIGYAGPVTTELRLGRDLVGAP